jgi:hypothetical protein
VSELERARMSLSKQTKLRGPNPGRQPERIQADYEVEIPLHKYVTHQPGTRTRTYTSRLLLLYVQKGVREPERIQAGAGELERIQASACCIRSGSRAFHAEGIQKGVREPERIQAGA